LTETAAKSLRDKTDFSHWRFTCDYKVAASQSGAATSLLKMFLVGVTPRTEVKATVSDVLAA
jgi:hypothetical protein